jgi:hypothetical protein
VGATMKRAGWALVRIGGVVKTNTLQWVRK